MVNVVGEVPQIRACGSRDAVWRHGPVGALGPRPAILGVERGGAAESYLTRSGPHPLPGRSTVWTWLRVVSG